MQTSRAVVVALVLSGPVFAATESDLTAAVVRSSLEWEGYWYGSPYNQQCIANATSKGAGLRALVGTDYLLVGYDCETRAPIREKVRVFQATGPGYGVLFSGLLDIAPHADLADGERNGRCTFTEGDLQERSAAILKNGVAAELPGPKSNGRNRPTPQVVNYVIRSIKSWSTRNAAAIPSAVTVANVASGDPYLLVHAAGDAEVRLLALPDAERVSDKRYCGLVYKSVRFNGREGPVKTIAPSNETFKANSTTVVID